MDGENIRVSVLAPLIKSVNGKPALPFLYEPPKTPPVELKEEDISPEMNIARRTKKNYSASHTINGHSVVLQLQYGRYDFYLLVILIKSQKLSYSNWQKIIK